MSGGEKLLGDADDVIAPLAGGAQVGDVLDGPLARLAEVFRPQAQAIAGGGGGGDAAGELDGDGEDEAVAVIGMLTDLVVAAGGAEEVQVGGGAVAGGELVSQE